jgi:hypothetical protein
MKARPFTVSIPDEELDNLRARLRTARWADDFDNADWRYGVERGWFEEMVAYWRDDYDWRATERQINRLPQFLVRLMAFRSTSSMSGARVLSPCRCCCCTAGRGLSWTSSS